MSSPSDFLKDYDLVEETIRKLYDSKLRLAILDALGDGQMRLADLRRKVNANAPNTSTKAKDLEDMGIVERVEGDFKLTPWGQAVREKMAEQLSFHAAYEQYKEFWTIHDISGIPDFLLKRLGDLNGSEIIRFGNNFDEVESEFQDQLMNSKHLLYGLSPVFIDAYSVLVGELMGRGANVQLILTKPVCLGMAKKFSKAKCNIWDKAKNLQLFEIRDVRVGFAVSELVFSLLLSKPNDRIGALYTNDELRSKSKEGIQWGLDLFEYYKKQAKPVKLSDYL